MTDHPSISGRSVDPAFNRRAEVKVGLPTGESTRRWCRAVAESDRAIRLIEEIQSQEAHDTLVDLLAVAYEQGFTDGWNDCSGEKNGD